MPELWRPPSYYGDGMPKKEIIRKKRNIAKQKEQDQKEQTYARVAEKNNRKNQ